MVNPNFALNTLNPSWHLLLGSKKDCAKWRYPADPLQHILIDKSFLFKVEVKTERFNEFQPTYNVIDICLNERIISAYRDLNSMFFTAQTDVTLGFSTGEKTSTHCISIGEASSCVKNLIEDFVEFDNNWNSTFGDNMTAFTPIKRMQDKEFKDEAGDESIKNLKSVKIEKK